MRCFSSRYSLGKFKLFKLTSSFVHFHLLYLYSSDLKNGLLLRLQFFYVNKLNSRFIAFDEKIYELRVVVN